MNTDTLTRKPRQNRVASPLPATGTITIRHTVFSGAGSSAARQWDEVSRIIGTKKATPVTIIDQIKVGIPASAIRLLQMQMDVTTDQLASTVNIPSRTLSRRIREGRLRSDESERVVRIVRLFVRATEILGSKDHARQWMRNPQRALGGQKPLDYADTEPGAEEVMNLLGRLEQGVFT
jgi:putative toxin-antitoxin system antitoxin component (TIGR02293 family)